MLQLQPESLEEPNGLGLLKGNIMAKLPKGSEKKVVI